MSLRQVTSNSDVESFEEKVKHLARTKYGYNYRPLEKVSIKMVDKDMLHGKRYWMWLTKEKRVTKSYDHSSPIHSARSYSYRYCNRTLLLSKKPTVTHLDIAEHLNICP